jgi:regulator of replication initiation timing
MRVSGLSARKQIGELEDENARLRRDNTDLRRNIAERETEIERLRRERDRLKEERDRLKDELEAARRAGKRQAAPFSRGEPKAEPKKPGRKPGQAYGPKRHRDIPSQVDEELDAHLLDECPKCGGEIGS